MFALVINLSTVVLLALLFILAEGIIGVVNQEVPTKFLKYLYATIMTYTAWTGLVALSLIGG